MCCCLPWFKVIALICDDVCVRLRWGQVLRVLKFETAVTLPHRYVLNFARLLGCVGVLLLLLCRYKSSCVVAAVRPAQLLKLHFPS